MFDAKTAETPNYLLRVDVKFCSSAVLSTDPWSGHMLQVLVRGCSWAVHKIVSEWCCSSQLQDGLRYIRLIFVEVCVVYSVHLVVLLMVLYISRHTTGMMAM